MTASPLYVQVAEHESKKISQSLKGKDKFAMSCVPADVYASRFCKYFEVRGFAACASPRLPHRVTPPRYPAPGTGQRTLRRKRRTRKRTLSFYFINWSLIQPARARVPCSARAGEVSVKNNGMCSKITSFQSRSGATRPARRPFLVPWRSPTATVGRLHEGALTCHDPGRRGDLGL